ncbi:hypothetical protein DCAR_0310003 [Daucus carota subsp. sativus]|uniref:Receptor-like serine/threonine-protein kinase n=2 Tax=Daucus carota subsp. sativus TaxID=79200 RepID=A0AAF0WM37_DAUCS|nr:PREDICTED: G-type lectin S-receptor-like serine/threonine-protein kinase At4g27290 [Daucus carota subsp. sativus]WOG90758.1 hypothetical protein DCAR_0310003 [Daucus carota subsp. sativus]
MVSANGEFELGFFSLGNSNSWYLGIQYKRAFGTVAWVANRDAPLTTSSGTLTLSSEGKLIIQNGTNMTIWSSSSSKSLGNPVAQLLDSGNLVIRTYNNSDTGLIWESFDFPYNSLLPGMRLGKNLVTGLDWSLKSWKRNNDLSPGIFQLKLDISGYPQMFLWDGSARYLRLGPWNGVSFSGVPNWGPSDIFNSEFVLNEKEMYYKYDFIYSSGLIRISTEPDGQIIRYTWTDGYNTWKPSILLQPDYCDAYARCGEYASCNSNSLCSCLDRFQPKNVKAWSRLNFSEGCVPEKQLHCSDKDGFVQQLNKKLPDTRRSTYNLSMNLKECEMKCLKNCSCTAYANTNITKEGSGCLIWFGGLIDIKEQGQSPDVFYVRVASGASSSSRARRIALIVIVTIVSILAVALIFYLWHVRRYRKQNREGEMMENEIDDGREDLPLFDFRTIANATNNFSSNFKLGEGGFGPVYKGVLENGKEIAVKRRSTCSAQGTEEFRNEVSCIAKLQHRNLVRLLGWSTEEGERILIYEYMPNKSLDYFIFGDTDQRASLNWPKRYNIINGIAKGLLYLHEDSRLRVIHRDLKTSNILLDYHLNPRISDFGTARRFADSQTEANTARVVGTYGYMSPEYAIEGEFSVKSDVYSFGVMIIEIVSGKKNRFFNHPGHNLNLIGHAWTGYNEDNLMELIDVPIQESGEEHEVYRVIHIGLLCVQQYPEDRPDMSSVLKMLSSKVPLPRPNQPVFFTERRLNEANPSHSQDGFSICSQTNTFFAPR